MDKLYKVFAAACGAVAAFFTGVPVIMWVLIAMMSLDYVTGLATGFAGVSSKTEGGHLSSRAAFAGPAGWVCAGGGLPGGAAHSRGAAGGASRGQLCFRRRGPSRGAGRRTRRCASGGGNGGVSGPTWAVFRGPGVFPGGAAGAERGAFPGRTAGPCRGGGPAGGAGGGAAACARGGGPGGGAAADHRFSRRRV